MDFQRSLNALWARHADNAEDVLRDALALTRDVPPDGVGALANLVFHVGGEHLGRFALVEAALGELVTVPETPAAAAPVYRCLAACAHCAGSEERACAYESRAVGDPAVNRGIVLGLVVSALAARGHAADASAHFDTLAALAETTDALHRSIAVTGNNVAASLEQRAPRSAEEDALMLRAARAARVYWERAGTWMNVERAEYRLAATHLARGEPGPAVEHAERVLAIVRDNGGDPGEAFFGWEILARARAAGGDRVGARAARDEAAACVPNVADTGFRAACESTLKTLDATVGFGE